MNPHDPLFQPSGLDSKPVHPQSNLIGLNYKLGPLVNLVASLPWSINDLLPVVFSGRATLGCQYDAPCQFDYFFMIDDRPVNEEEHDEVCSTLAKHLFQIIAWCNENSVQLVPLIDAEVSQGHLLMPQTVAEWRRERSPIFLLEIMRDFASGKSHVDGVAELRKYHVQADVKTTIGQLNPRIIEAFSKSFRMIVNKDETRLPVPYEVLPAGRFYGELGIEYQRLSAGSIVTRHEKVPFAKNFAELSELQTTMFEMLLNAPDYKCSDEQLHGAAGKPHKRDSKRKLRDALNEVDPGFRTTG